MLGWPLLALLAGCGGGSSDGGSPSVPMGPPGTLDATFGAGGVVLTTPSVPVAANAIVLQPDGKIVVVGSIGEGAGKSFYLSRYKPDGSLDAAFGTGGTVNTVFDPAAGSEAFAVLLQPDGKIVAVGGTAGACALARYSADGALDTGFGTGGIVRSESAQEQGMCAGAAMQPDGKIVTAFGSSFVDLFGRGSVMRFDPTGRRDSAFGVAGEAGFDCLASSCQPSGVVVGNDGRLIVSGMAWIDAPFGGETKVVLAQFASQGTIDQEFGLRGFATPGPHVFFSCGPTGLAIHADGRIVSFVRGGCYGLSRTNVDGSPDLGFGSSGIAAGAGNGLVGNAIGLQANAKIVAAGARVEYSTDDHLLSTVAMIRYESSGALDSGFGTAGVVFAPIAGSGAANAVAIQPDGQIVIAGNVTLASGQKGIFVARYFGDPAATAAR